MDTGKCVYRFADCVVDCSSGKLTRQGEYVKLRPKSFDLMCFLLERHGQLVPKRDIIEQVWQGADITDDAVTQSLIDIRKAIGDKQQSMIRTVPRRGYVFEEELLPQKTGEQRQEDELATSNSNVSASYKFIFACTLLVSLLLVTYSVFFLNKNEDSADSTNEYSVSQNLLAVLPFADLSEDQDLQYYSDGISEEILNILKIVPDIQVVSKTSSFLFRDQPADVTAIGRDLNARFILEGSVKESDGLLQITAQLSDAITGEAVWSEVYDVENSNIFLIQDRITRSVSRSLTGGDSLVSSGSYTDNLEVYNLYLQAKHMGSKVQHGLLPSENGQEETIRLLEQALELDSQYAPAWRELSLAYWRIANRSPSKDNIALSGESLHRALTLVPNDAAALAFSGWGAQDFFGDLQTAASLFERAIFNEPGNEDVVRTATPFILGMGLYEDAIAFTRNGIVNNPLCNSCYRVSCRSYIWNEDWQEGEAICRKRVELFAEGRWMLAIVLVNLGRIEEALQVGRSERLPTMRHYALAYAYLRLNRMQAFDQELVNLRSATSNGRLFAIANLLAQAGRIDEAFIEIDEYLKILRVYEDGELIRTGLENYFSELRSPFLAPLHGDPRWQQLIDELGISDEDLAAVSFNVNLK